MQTVHMMNRIPQDTLLCLDLGTQCQCGASYTKDVLKEGK